MPDETHKLQKQPAEGSRKIVERELERQDAKADGKPQPDQKKTKRAEEDGRSS